MQAKGTAVRPWGFIAVADRRASDAPGTPRRGRALARNLPNMSASAWWASSPRTLMVDGIPVIVFPVGALARALGRTSHTLRVWERYGVLPPTPFRDDRGPIERQRRYYTFQMIAAAERIAAQELPAGKVADFRRERRFIGRVAEEWNQILLDHQAAATASPTSNRLSPVRPGTGLHRGWCD
jgi:DNA-binding transcriptional MerR regulator